MRKSKTFIFISLVLSLLVLVSTGCSVLKPKFDPIGYEYALSIKDDALILISKSEQSFSLHKESVYRLMTRVERAYEHARTLYKNNSVTGIWDVLRDPKANRLGRFIEEWEKEDTLDARYIEEAKKMISEDFKILLELEEKKKK